MAHYRILAGRKLVSEPTQYAYLVYNRVLSPGDRGSVCAVSLDLNSAKVYVERVTNSNLQYCIDNPDSRYDWYRAYQWIFDWDEDIREDNPRYHQWRYYFAQDKSKDPDDNDWLNWFYIEQVELIVAIESASS